MRARERNGCAFVCRPLCSYRGRGERGLMRRFSNAWCRPGARRSGREGSSVLATKRRSASPHPSPPHLTPLLSTQSALPESTSRASGALPSSAPRCTAPSSSPGWRCSTGALARPRTCARCGGGGGGSACSVLGPFAREGLVGDVVAVWVLCWCVGRGCAHAGCGWRARQGRVGRNSRRPSTIGITLSRKHLLQIQTKQQHVRQAMVKSAVGQVCRKGKEGLAVAGMLQRERAS